MAEKERDASGREPSALVDRCIKDFFDSLEPNEQRIFTASTLASTLLEEVKSAEAQYSDASIHKVAEVILPFIKGIERYGEALDVFANSNSILNAVWGSLRVVLVWARDFGEYFAKLADMLEEIGHVLGRLPRIHHLYPENAIFREAVVEIYRAIFDFCIKAKHVFRTGKTHFCGLKSMKAAVGFTTALRMVWKPFKVQFGDIKDRIAKNVEIIDAESDLAERELANSERRLDDARWTKQEASQRLIAQYIDGESMVKVNNWLAPANVSLNHTAASKLRHANTGDWFVASDVFQKWLHESNSFLWLSAIPGAGKTVLASSIINYLQENVQSKDVGLAYFYCDYKDVTKQDPTKLLGTILAQLAKQNQNVYDAIASFFLQHYQHSATFVAEFDELLNNFSSFVNGHFREVIVVVDALDEADSKEWGCLTYSLKTLHQHCHELKLLVTSRNERAIARDFEGLPATTIEEADVAGDIAEFIRATLTDRIEKKKLKLRDPELEAVIRQTLLDGARGMFQWVTCQIDALSGLRNDKAIRAALGDLPRTLQETYLRILKRIEEDHPDDVDVIRRILCFLVRGVRDFSLPELAEGIAIDPDAGEESMDFSAVDTDPEDMLDLLGGLVTVSPDQAISLAHLSVKEFLVSYSLEKSKSPFWVGERDVEAQLARTCLTFLCYDDFRQPVGEERIKERLAKYKFYRYAVEAWAVHAQRSEISRKQPAEVIELTMRLLGSRQESLEGSDGDESLEGNYQSWKEVYRSMRKHIGPLVKAADQHQLDYAAYFGLTEAVQHLLDEGHDSRLWVPLRAAVVAGHAGVTEILLKRYEETVAARDNTDASNPFPGEDVDLGGLLYMAAAGGHTDIINLLLDHGADVNVMGGKDGTAIQAAALQGRADAVRLLIKRGASHAIPCKRYGTPLAAAAEKGHERTASVLLEFKANPNGRGGWYSIPLVSAIVGRNVSIVRKLIEAGADLNARGGRHGCPLMAAAALGMDELIEELVEAGAKVNDEDDKSSDALYAASLAGHVHTVELLLRLGADIDAKGGKHRNAVGAAASEGHVGLLKLLIEKGADVTYSDEHYGTALQTAAARGYGEAVRLLAEAGADPLDSNGDKGTALERAAAGGHDDAIVVLHELGAETTPETATGALVAAAYAGQLSTVKLLIKMGVHPNYVNGESQTDKYCTALEAAASKGHKDVVELLLSSGDDASGYNDGWFGTALIASINTDDRDLETVELLLTKGSADPNLAGPNKDSHSYGTPLVHAVWRGDADVVRLLLEHGADVNLTHKTIETAAQAAAARGDFAIGEILLEAGADVNIACEPPNVWNDIQNGLDNAATITALQGAAFNGQVEMVRKLLELGAKLSIDVERAPFGSALQAAAYAGQEEIVRILLDAGSDVNEISGYFGTALQAAAAKHNLSVMKMLIEAGANVNDCYGKGYKDWQGFFGSSLFALCFGERNDESEACMQLLLDHGVDVNARSARTIQPYALIGAVKTQAETTFAKMLLEHGANPNVCGGQFGTALQAAAYDGDSSHIQLLLDHGADPNITGGWYHTPLQMAFRHGFYIVIGQLRRAGARTDLLGGFGGSVMGSALGLSNKVDGYGGACATLVHQLVKTLQYDVNLKYGLYGNALQDCIICNREDQSFYHIINAGADINAVGGKCATALATAAYMGIQEYVDYLLEHGARIDLGTDRWPNAAFGAVFGMEAKILQQLIDKGADVVHAVSGEFGTTLQCAAIRSGRKGNEKKAMHIIRILVHAGAEVNPAKASGRHGHPLQAALVARNEDIVRYLVNRGADVRAPGGKFGGPMNAATLHASPEVVELLLKKGADVNERGKFHASPLQGACARGSIEVALMLIRAGADVNAKGGRYHTALQAACQSGKLALIKLLVEHGADLNVRGGRHAYALQACVESSGQGESERANVRYMLESGAEFHLMDRKMARWAGQFTYGDDILESVRREVAGEPPVEKGEKGGDGDEETLGDGEKGEEKEDAWKDDKTEVDDGDVEEEKIKPERPIIPLNVESIPDFQRPWKKASKWDGVKDLTINDLRQKSIMAVMQRFPGVGSSSGLGSAENGNEDMINGTGNGSAKPTSKRGASWPNGQRNGATDDLSLRKTSRTMPVDGSNGGVGSGSGSGGAEGDNGDDAGLQDLTLLDEGEIGPG